MAKNSDTSVEYVVYSDQIESPTYQDIVNRDTFKQAHSLALKFVAEGRTLVHIRKLTAGDGITEELVWAAATPEIDWR
ncbi:MAG: hypothetical protein EOO40_00880 [Deltaproteobacteria bacterium]|nr:MAG: hypothetical protein EOO40_00880 [Deltaproteobacteria bacterium]